MSTLERFSRTGGDRGSALIGNPDPSGENPEQERYTVSRGDRASAHRAEFYGMKKKAPTASSQLGEIYRAEWENWMNQFLPVDRKLMELANSDQDNIMAESDAISVTRTGFENARKSDELARRGLGVNLQADEKAYLDKKSGLAEAAALATNVNNTRLHAADRDRQIMSGGLTGGLRDLTNVTG